MKIIADKQKWKISQKKKVLQPEENFVPAIRWKVLVASGDEGVKRKVLCCCHQPEKLFIWKLHSSVSNGFRFQCHVQNAVTRKKSIDQVQKKNKIVVSGESHQISTKKKHKDAHRKVGRTKVANNYFKIANNKKLPLVTRSTSC